MRNHKNLQIRPSFWEWDIFVKLGRGGNFSKPFFSKGIYLFTLHWSWKTKKNEKQKNLKTMKYLQQLKYRSRNLVGAFPHDKKIIAFRKSEVGTLKSIFDETLVNTKIKLDTFDACLQQKSM